MKFCLQETNDFEFDVPLECAMMSKTFINTGDDDEDEVTSIRLPYQGNISRRAFKFCHSNIKEPYHPITHPIDKVKALPNFYNDFLEDLTPDLVVSLLHVSDFLDIPPLTQLICFKLAYLMRDMSYKERIDYFRMNDSVTMEYAEM